MKLKSYKIDSLSYNVNFLQLNENIKIHEWPHIKDRQTFKWHQMTSFGFLSGQSIDLSFSKSLSLCLCFLPPEVTHHPPPPIETAPAPILLLRSPS
ncbi:hypothetical protein L2E82_48908 [Cichorium intybus]|uniref:Uncharacterized protein n=1 Tax=Cichorium intybus TaxID=13427 RepID=A0ACB8YZB0_CICIN|nr:hypothetical protein L2E82_48908 [Cichorium intybus]